MNHKDKIEYYESLFDYDAKVVDKIVQGVKSGKISEGETQLKRNDMHCLSAIALTLQIGSAIVDIVELDGSNSGGGNPSWYSVPGIFTAAECYQIYKHTHPYIQQARESRAKALLQKEKDENAILRNNILSVLQGQIMGQHTVRKNDELCYNALFDYVNRGELYAAYSNDRKFVWVNWGCPEGYPLGETFANIPVHHIPDLIAALQAVLHTK